MIFLIQIAYWRETFDVSIKRSFVRSDIDYPHRMNNVIRNINWAGPILNSKYSLKRW